MVLIVYFTFKEPWTNLFAALKRHVKHVHGSQEPTRLKRVCDECGAMFLTLNAFENHKQLHRGENPYKCKIDDCEKIFADATGKISNLLMWPIVYYIYMFWWWRQKSRFPSLLLLTKQHNELHHRNEKNIHHLNQSSKHLIFTLPI